MRAVKLILMLLIAAIANNCLAGVKEEVSGTIVRVKSGNKYSTGFFWSNGTTVITTLHSLNSSTDIQVYIPSIRTWKPVTLKKVYKHADMVLMQVNGYASAKFISSKYTTPPPTDTRAFTVGYYAGNSSYVDKDFVVGLAQGNTLDDILPVATKQEIRNLGFPSLTTTIVYLKGSLLSGFSGAPIVDMQGRLIGVADGGLENGAAGISWCVNSSHISSLESSVESMPMLNHTKINALFAAEDYQNKEAVIEEAVRVSNFEFKKIKTRTFSQMDMTAKYSSIDGLGLIQMLAYFAALGFDYESVEYDVYMEVSSGATIVIPAGEELRAENGMLVAGSNKVKLYLYLQQTYDVQQTSLDFEYAIMPNYDYNWMADEDWTYPFPIDGPNNSLIRRRAYTTYDQANYLYETLAASGDYFLGVAALRDNYNQTQQDGEEWARFAIGIQLSSFSN